MLSIHNAQAVALPRHTGKVRPAKAKKPDFYVYRIEGNPASLIQERKSCFILPTNQLDCEELSDWIFQFFSGIHLLIIGGTQQVVLNLNEHHLRLLKLLGRRSEKLYSGNG